MLCGCNELKRDPVTIKTYEKLAKQITKVNLSLDRSHYKNIEQLTYWSNFPVSHAKNQADEIIRPVITAVKDYDGPFNQNYSQALSLVDQVSSDPVAVLAFKAYINDIYINVKRIGELAQIAHGQLNILREETAREISYLATQIQQADLEKTTLQNQIRILEEEISALQRELDNLNWLWLLCIVIFLCLWLPPLIQEVAFNKSQKQAELRQKTFELNQANIRLMQLTSYHQSLSAAYQTNLQVLASIITASGACTFMLNNISGIFESLENIDPNYTPTALRRQLTVLKQNWDELVSEMNLLAVALNMQFSFRF